MPLYTYRCLKCGEFDERFVKIAELDLPQLCNCGTAMEKQLEAPAVRGDYSGYSCPVTGKWIEGRKAHEDNLRRTGCRVLEPGEREQNLAARKARDEKLDREVETTADKLITNLPAREKERLTAEMQQGVTATVLRQ